MSEELLHLERIAGDSLYAAGMNTEMIKYSFSILCRHLRGTSILEMGPAEGVMTEFLAQTGKELSLVEGSSFFCRVLASRYPHAEVSHCLFEEFEPLKSFDTIVLGHVLEHVEDPVKVLARARSWLQPNGVIFAAVPNARSVHRQAAVLMGLLSEEHELNEMDHHHGHRRVFDPESFRAAFLRADLQIEVFGGYWLKPLSNAQIEESWTQPMIDSFMKLGERYPDIAGEIYIVASARE
jgi:2-polyprenyl-3-methyl-5-hydroxy-6-metoxy-1,4-benzoquinol methylase